MQAVISCQELIDRPSAEDPLLRFVHLQMNLVPRPVMKNHNGHEGSCSMPGYQCNNRGNWNSLDRRLAHGQANLLVFTTSDRFIAEYLGVVLVVHKSVSLKYTLEGRSMHTEEIRSVHQLPVNLVLDKGHQNARENEPATDRQNKHQRSLDSPVGDKQHEHPPEAVALSTGPRRRDIKVPDSVTSPPQTTTGRNLE